MVEPVKYGTLESSVCGGRIRLQSVVLGEEPLVCWLYTGNRLWFSIQVFQTPAYHSR